MPLIQLIVLAIIQGVTEFLPISSSAHLILAPIAADGWDDQGPLIDVAAHVGSLFAVMAYFRAETMMLLRGGLDAARLRPSADRKLFVFIAAGTAPLLAAAAVLVGLDLVDKLRNMTTIGLASILFGWALWLSDQAPREKEGLERITWREALLIGAAQALALIPGASRSGVTMTAARFMGWTREEAARYAMLLSIPAIGALGAFAAIDLIREGARAEMEAAAIVAALSFATALASIAALMHFIRRIGFTPFVIYRIAMGAALLAISFGLFG